MSRGRCGGPIVKGEPDAVYDGAELPNLGPEYDILRGGWYVPDHNVVRIPFAESDAKEDGRWRACPVAEMRRMMPIIHLWRRHKLGVEPVSEAVRTPSAALVEAFEVLAIAEIEVDNGHMRVIMGGGGG